jgi:hypothetical protein
LLEVHRNRRNQIMQRVVGRPLYSIATRAWVLGLALASLLAWPAPLPAAAAEPQPTAMPSAPAMGGSHGHPERLGDPGPDRTPYRRPVLAGEQQHATIQTADVTLVDLVIAAGIAGIDTVGGTETSIAVDPNDPNHITVSAFSHRWEGSPSSASLWVSNDGGTTWQKDFSLTMPPGQPGAVRGPYDQTFDYGKNSPNLFGATLGCGVYDPNNGHCIQSGLIWSGGTSDPTSDTAWQWLINGGVAVPTSQTATAADLPWLRVERDPDLPTQDDVYVAYIDYSQGLTKPAVNHVAVSFGGTLPPSFTQDVIVSTSAGAGYMASAALRIATDPTRGTVWAAWQDAIGLDQVTCAKGVSYRLARSIDHGQTWTPALNGGTSPIVSVQLSDEGQPGTGDPNNPTCNNSVEKFGTVNALLGGSNAIAVDPGNGDVYYVFHMRDSATGNNRLSIARIADNAPGGVAFATFLTGQVQAALPSVAVAQNGTVGVLYDVSDSITDYPQFSTHFATSIDHGVTWNDQTLVTFWSPALNDTSQAGRTQRVLGDFQQLTAVGNTFYAAFPANRALFGPSISIIDPVFYKTGAPGVPLRFSTLAPCRVLDTRNADGPLGGPALSASATRTFAAAGTCGIPATARAISVNVTVTGGSAAGDIRLYQTSTTVPPTNVISFAPGRTRANNAILSLSRGNFTALLDSAGAVHMILDVNGYFD